MLNHSSLSRRGTLGCGLALALALLAGAAQAQSYRLMLQTRADGSAGSEVFVASYGSYAGFVGSQAAVGGDFSGIDVGAQYQVSGLAYDGQYRLLLSTRNDGGPSSEVFVATYASYADLIASPAAVGGDFSGIDIGSSYEVVAFAYDGKYRLVLQTRTDSGPPGEVFIASYDSFADFVASPAAVGGSFSGIDVGASYKVAGLAYDGQYRLLLTTRADDFAASEVFVATYATFDDLVNSPAAVGGDFSGIDIGSAYRVAAFAYETAPIPEPGTAALFALGLATTGWIGRRRMSRRSRTAARGRPAGQLSPAAASVPSPPPVRVPSRR
jgi:hypothetical protein